MHVFCIRYSSSYYYCFPRLCFRCPTGGDTAVAAAPQEAIITAVAAAAVRSAQLANEPDAVLVQGGFERRTGVHLVDLNEQLMPEMPGAEAVYPAH